MTKTVEESLPPRLRNRLRNLMQEWHEKAHVERAMSARQEAASAAIVECIDDLESLLGDWDV